ncbi:MAG TPA: CBS domain-containing protein [Magnetospirillaceae bacterium]|nr:CBS domain-containing protein [Magnetospirillaceae bacterium]
MIVRTILTSKPNTDVATTVAGQKVGEAAKLLDQRRIGALVVVDDQRALAGILSERDIVRGLSRHGLAVLDMQVGQLMTADVLTCTPDDSIDSLMSTMTSNRIRHLPVLEGGRLAGIITIGDVVKARLEETTMQVDSLREYVMNAH